MRKILFLVIAVAVLGVGTAHAQGDPNLFICSGCSNAPGSPTIITNPGSITLGVAGNYGGGAYTLVILGVPGGPLGTAPTVGGATLLNGPTGTTFSGSGSAYSALGLKAGGGASEMISNWSAATIDMGTVTNPDAGVTSYTLYEYLLPINTPPGVNQTITFSVSGAPTGTWVIGFSCTSGTVSSTGATCPDNGLGTTPFTTSGIINTPEPGTFELLGAGLLGLAGLALRRR